jgi:hypothetical protein
VLEHKKPEKLITRIETDNCLSDDLTRLPLAQKFERGRAYFDMKIARMAPHECVPPRYPEGTECEVSVTLQCLFERAGERRLTGTRTARDYVQESDRLIAKNEGVAEAS